MDSNILRICLGNKSTVNIAYQIFFLVLESNHKSYSVRAFWLVLAANVLVVCVNQCVYAVLYCTVHITHMHVYTNVAFNVMECFLSIIFIFIILIWWIDGCEWALLKFHWNGDKQCVVCALCFVCCSLFIRWIFIMTLFCVDLPQQLVPSSPSRDNVYLFAIHDWSWYLCACMWITLR